MARCKECLHYDICAREGRMVQIDEHTWDDYNQLDDVEHFCDKYLATADVAPKSEVAREIFEEIDTMIFGAIIPNDCAIISIAKLAELKKKYTEEKK